MTMFHSGLKASVPTEQDDAMTSHTPGPWKACGTIYEHMNAEIRSGAKGEGQGIAQVWDGPNAFPDALLIAAAPDHALVAWAVCAGIGRWDHAYGGGPKGEFCIFGMRHSTELDRFGVPAVTTNLRFVLQQASGASPSTCGTEPSSGAVNQARSALPGSAQG